MDKPIDEILKRYPYICDDVQRLQTELNKYLQLQAELRDPLRAVTLEAGGVKSGISDSTYMAVERIVDVYQAEIDSIVQQINGLLDEKKWLDKAISSLTEDERRVLYLRYSDRYPTWKILRRMGMLKYDTLYRLIDSAKDKVKKVVLK